VPIAASFGQVDIAMVNIPYLAYRSYASLIKAAKLPGRQPHQNVACLSGHNLGRHPGATHHLPTLAEVKLDIMDCGAHRDQL
jgi:hypothetical protein